MKKIFKAIIIILILIFSLTLMVSCDSDREKNDNQELTIILKTDGGSNDNEKASVSVDDELPNPQKEGFAFRGWYLDEDFSVPYNDKNIKNTHSIEGEIAVFAQWDPVDFNIEYKLNGGEENPANPSTYTINDQITIYPPSRTGYTFEGWYYNEMFTGNQISQIMAGTVGDKILHALWTPFDITYILNGGVNNPANVPTYDGYEQVELLSPTKVGYNFAGWYDNEGFEGEPISYIAQGSARSRDFYAKWTLKSYDIDYEMDGGQNHQDNPLSYNTNLSFTLNDPQKSGYDFEGWYDNQLFEGAAISEIEEGGFGDLVFYAKWSEINYNINYVLYGGENPLNPTIYTIEDEVVFEDAIRDGYSFEGWYDASNRLVEKIDVGTMGSITLYASWQLKDYDITYHLNGGDASNPTTYNVQSSIELQPASRQGYIFKGWYEQQDFSGEEVTHLPLEQPGDISLYARFLVRYVIYYNLDQGQLPSGYIQAFTVEDAAQLPQPEKNGYSFEGWFDNSAFQGDEITEIIKGTDYNITIYAKWQAVDYSLTYYLNDGDPVENPESYTVEDSFELNSPQRHGYDFLGWFDNPEFSGESIDEIEEGFSGDMDLYASWTPTVYNLFFITLGGSHSNPLTYTIQDEIDLLDASREGYVFDSWYSDSEYQDEMTSITLGTTGDLSFFANYFEIYEINYTVFGGTNSPSNPQEYTVIDEIELLPATRSGYRFMGWYESSNFYGEKVEFINNRTGHINLYARFLLEYDINYELDGGTNSPLNPSTIVDEQAVQLEEAEKLGYAFLGWFDGDDFENSITQIPAGATEDITIYALWEVIEYSLTYYLDGGENHSSNPASYTVNNGVTLMPATKEGYRFMGWYTDDDFIGASVSQIPKGSTGNKDLYAKLLEIFSITYDTQGGQNSDFNPIVFTEDDTLSLYDAEKEGYDFMGWEYDSQIIDQIDGMTGDVLLTAVWDVTVYDIVYHTFDGTTDSPLSYTILDEITLLSAQKTHYVFTGWYDNSEFEGDAVTQIEEGSTGEIELFAHYELYDYQILYQLNGGKNNAGNPLTYTIMDEVIFLNPTRNEFKFLGWYANPEFEGQKVEGIEEGSFGEIEIYAKWDIKIYSVVYMLFGGENSPQNPATYTTEDEFTLHPASRYEYVFGGWYLVDTRDMTSQQLQNNNIYAITTINQNTVGNLVLYARWLSDTYEIDYVLESGGVNNQNNPYYYTRDDEFELYPATKTNYTFIGWYDNAEYNGEPIEEISLGSLGNKTFYARFSFTYNVEYMLYGGSYPNMVETYTELDNDIELGVPIKPGFAFMGWYLTSDFSQEEYTHIITSDKEDKVFHAKFLQEFDLVYILYSGVNHEDNPEMFTKEDEFSLYPASRTGYLFDGWYDNQDFIGEEIEQVGPGETENLTLYAKFLFINVLIYHLNGGQNHPENPSYFTNEDNIDLLEASRVGYSFTGWFDNPNFIGTAVEEVGQSSSGLRNLYARWELVDYSIQYTLNGGFNNSNNPATYNINSQLIEFEDPSRTYYQFMGWYSQPDFSGNRVYVIAAQSTGNRNLYAKWQPIEYTINYMNLMGGDNHPDNPASFNVETGLIELEDPEKEGAIFQNWYNNASFTGSPITAIQEDASGDRYLYAKWSFEVYNITYHLEAGTENHPDNPSTYTVAVDVTLKAPSKGYYTFIGWYDNAEREGDIVVTTEDRTGDLDLYPLFSLTQHINYALNGGVNHPDNPARFTELSPTIVLNEPTREYYLFEGWYYSSDFSGDEVFEITEGSDFDVYLYAKWQAEAYDIIYHLYGGENHQDNPSQYTVETFGIYFINPEKTGYQFEGWYDNDSFEGSQITHIPMGADGDVELYAKWALIEYEINYYNVLPEENNTQNPLSYTTETGEITLFEPSRDDYDFEGWYDDELIEEAELVDIIAHDSLGDINLYAKWVATEYQIVYHLYGGDNNESNPETYNVENIYSLHTPSREHYTFVNWYTNQNFTSNPITQIENRSGELNLYAKWNANNFSIIYNFQDGNNHLDNPSTYTVEDSFTFKPATKANYNFMGWFDTSEPDEEDQPIVGIDEGSWGNITLYAKFLISYEITYHLDGGVNSANNPASYTVEDVIELEPALKPSYIFIGWYDNEEWLGQPIEIIEGESIDIELFAHFEMVYNLTYVLYGGGNNPENPSYYTEDMNIVLKEPVRSGYMFLGWYDNADFSGEPIEEISGQTKQDIELHAWWGEWGFHMYYGEYPQTLVTDSDTITALNSIVDDPLLDPDEQGYYHYGEEKYAMIEADKSVNGYISGNTYYFLVEPIKWRILNNDDGELVLISDLILDANGYNDVYQSIDWENSSLREWLNQDFYDTAFYNNDYHIQTKDTLESQNPIHGFSSGQTTSDKVRLLSIEEVTNYDYGFNESMSAYDNNRIAKNSDYASIMGAYSDSQDNGVWWLYTPGGNSRYTSFVGADGRVYANGNNCTLDYYGVRMAIVIDVNGSD